MDKIVGISINTPGGSLENAIAALYEKIKSRNASICFLAYISYGPIAVAYGICAAGGMYGAMNIISYSSSGAAWRRYVSIYAGHCYLSDQELISTPTQVS